MKHIKYTLAAIGVALCGGMLTSCEDFLTEDSRGVENLDTYFQTEEEIANYTVGCYNNLTFYGWWQIEYPWMLFDVASDDLWAGNTSQDCDFYAISEFRDTQAQVGEISNFWQYRYKGILNCNIGISRVQESNLDESITNQYEAEMRFLRAYYYFDLTKNFGALPFITSFAMPSELEGITRTDQSEIYAFIEEELEWAAAHLPERSEYSSSDMGRATRGAVLGILAKAQLYQEKWAACAATCQKIIDSGEYSLNANYGDCWSIAGNNSREGIFEVQFIYDATYSLGSSIPTFTGARNGPGDGWSWFQPTSDLENAFIAAGDTERLRWSIIKCGCTEIAGEDQFDEFIANNDNLDATTVAAWEAEFGFDASQSYIIRPDQHKSGRIMRKFFIPLTDRPEVYNTDKVPQNYRILRYSDVLLMAAEAYNESGNDGSARTYLNMVRNRVGLDNVITSGNELREAIRLERRLELCFESNRIYDIRRWKVNGSSDRVISQIMGSNGTFVKYNATMSDPYEAYNQVESSTAKGSGFRADRDLLFPIPTYEVQQSNGSITQNPNF